jgi:hypothetical protein
MSDDNSLPPVLDDELLVRFILSSSGYTKDLAVTANAFMPNPNTMDTSVFRHSGLSENEMWKIGEQIANLRPAKLHGRADVIAIHVKKQSLSIQPTREPKNHANITGWPSDKPSRKIKALAIALAAGKMVTRP